MASAPDTVGELINLLGGLKDHGVMISSLPLMVDISTGPDPVYVPGVVEYVRSESTDHRWLVVRPKPAGA